MKKILLILFLCSIQLSFSQKVSDKNDVKVGLVLSGGGAKGLAHIGVIKVIEELGIEIDYIGGASMGSIIGGLYASGYSADSISEIANNLNWISFFTDEEQRQNLSIINKVEQLVGKSPSACIIPSSIQLPKKETC